MPERYTLQATLRKARSAADAVRIALSYHGFHVSEYAAQQAADAALNHPDNIMNVQEHIPRPMWEDASGHNHALQHLRYRLLDEITSRGCVPTALPTQSLTYMTLRFGVDTPASGSDIEPAEWDMVVVRLSAPIRTPPIDRKAAVQAGILNGELT